MSEGPSLFASFGPNAGYVQELYELYRTDRTLVPISWAHTFDQLFGVDRPLPKNGHTTSPATPTTVTNGHHATSSTSPSSDLQERVFRLVRAYRERGHLRAKINPIANGILPMPVPRDVQAEQYGFTEQELQSEVRCERFQGKSTVRLAELIEQLDQVYCDSIGVEFMHLFNNEARDYIRERFEVRPLKSSQFTNEQQRRIFKKLVTSEVMETELHKKYIGQKWFSLKGGETMIPMLDTLLNTAIEEGVHEAFIGMAHRGRINVLTNTLGKPLAEILNEFEDKSLASVVGAGDAKYHLGFSGIHTSGSGQTLKIELVPNPSHLEAVNAVVEGISRARQDIYYNRDRSSVLPILIHGDAAFIGQGIVPETLNLVALPGYTTGGTIHVVINNQVGFTTNPDESRSSIYCTDLAKAFEAPVFHVNAEDAEAACWIMQLALKFRNKFKRDVVVDLICYRKFGHNEGDDPSFTQPVLYAEISRKPGLAKVYADQLVSRGSITQEDADAIFAQESAHFKEVDSTRPPRSFGEACAVHGRLVAPEPKTAVAIEPLRDIAKTLITYPEGFKPTPKLEKILEKRVESLENGKTIDWGFAEGLAFGSLLKEGRPVRLSGQDCGRGTFSQRHLLLNHFERLERYVPFDPIARGSGTHFDILNSSLSEVGVVGFEFGYGTELDNGLVIWEGQFGDFANGAQVMIDQFISSSEAKWAQHSCVTLMLPHAYEGQGPEHSSARLERFLQLCAEGNMRVCYPSNAAQHFHLLRRQALTEIRRPLIVMTPKSLLRHPGAACSSGDLTTGSFKRVIVEELGAGKPSDTVVFLSGKIYYDVAPALQKLTNTKVRLVRVEELYPFPDKEIKKALKELKPKRVVWAQEEPQNMGAWTFIRDYLKDLYEIEAEYIGRHACASPATGSHKAHAREQEQIVKAVVATA